MLDCTRGLVTTFVLLGLAVQAAQAAQDARSLSDLSGPWRLFVDDHYVASKENVTRTYHAFRKYEKNPILVADKPWEGKAVYVYGTVLPTEDGAGWRMWYQTLTTQGAHMLYATSDDGITWHKPALGIQEWKGSEQNNLFFQRDHGTGIASVIHTPWDPDPNRQYRVMNYDFGGYAAAWSPDGVHMIDAPNNPVLTHAGDVGQFLWDPFTREYLGYVKIIRDVRGLRRRSVGRVATKEIDSWPDPELVLAPDDFDDRWTKPGTVQRTHFYGLSAFAYESMYLGFLWVFRAEGEPGYFFGPVYTELVMSHDGVHWYREEGDRPAMLDVGPEGAWDDGQLYTAVAPVRVGDRLRVYYGAADMGHGSPVKKLRCAIGLAELRTDGFASLDAGPVEGTITTKRLVGARGPLYVNGAARGGSIRVEVLDAAGNVVPGYGRDACDAISGDGIEQAVRWKRHAELPGGAEPIRLRFVVKEASVYSFQGGEAIEVLDEAAGPTLAVLCTFEGDRKRRVRDTLREDGENRIECHGGAEVDGDAKLAAFGARSLAIGSPWRPINTLELGGTANLGTRFTLALMARLEKKHPARWFSAYDSCGPVNGSELVFDWSPYGEQASCLRLIGKGIEVYSRRVAIEPGTYHAIAVTYDDGLVRFYLDGEGAGEARLPGGAPVALAGNLHVGEDPALGTDEQLSGHVDDVVVLGRVLSAGEIRALATKGAEALFGAAAAGAGDEGA
jgi:hypothetical protein